MTATATPATAYGETRPHRRHRRFPSTPSRTSNNSGGSGAAAAAAAADASNSNPNNPRLRRLQRLRLSSSLQQRALLQKCVDAQENDDFARDMRYSSETLEGIPSGSLTATSASTGSTTSSADSASDDNNTTTTTTCGGSGIAWRENVLQMARRKVTSPRRAQQQHKTVASSSPAPFHRVDSAVSSLGCSKFTEFPDENHHNIDGHGVDEAEQEDALSTSKLHEDDAVDPGYIPGLAIASSFEQIEQIREDIDSFEREAAAEAEAAAGATAAVEDEMSNNGIDDGAASRTPSHYCDQPHLLAGPKDELSFTQNLEDMPARLPSPPPRGHHRYEELGCMYRTPDILTDRQTPVSSKDVDDIGEPPSLSLSLCSSPYSSYEVTDEEQPFDVVSTPRALSPCSNLFDITVTDAEETPFDEGSSIGDCDLDDDDEESPFDESRSISPLSHPANQHKSRPTARSIANSAHHNGQALTASDLAYSLASLTDGPHNTTLSEEEDPTFLESLAFTKSDGRLTPETYNGKHLLSRSYGTASPSGADDEPSI
eukprot:CAMPEP_0181074762 /NCGR_PEP_ID=MMETSP1070-20121207/29764_1 /TAXON_ID=265543 /ORGANISM="Minutocellus polymorphus, Strain NH13" /LENGTH=541 /DNA_ID=CAMNT_0023155879 /DNA_START=115 /DNA_END=1740 /DNA_ORIENTATION=-